MNPLTQTVTILFTDIENSTILWEKYPQAMAEALAAHDAILQEAITANQGQVVKTTGDGFYAVFASALPAIAAVIAAQRELIAYPWEGISSIKVRMALHTGEASLRQGDYYGTAVNRAARLMSLAAGDQILLSGTTAHLVRDNMPPDSTLASLGQYTLRGLSRPEDVYQLVHPALPASFPPLLSKKDYPNNLPRMLTRFVDREEEVAEICGELTNQDTRLLTLVGPGGVGKTRLSLQAAHDCLDHFPNGTYFVSLAQVREAAEVPTAIMEAMELHALGSRPVIDQLKTYLEYARTLIILDNFEHVMEARSVTSDLLSATARLSVVVTSRFSLNIYGEKTYHIMPLRLPEPRAHATYQTLVQSPAVRLFLERAQALDRDFALHKQDIEPILQICKRLDGLPLALELAAVNLKTFSPREIVKQLDKGTRLLRGGPSDLPERHQTLRATIQWSHDLLGQQERILFRRMAVFAGGSTLDSIEAICAFRTSSSTSEIDVLDGLARLIDQNLILKSTASGHSRYSMLKTIRDYALEQLSGSNDAEEVSRNHIGYYLALAENADREMTGPKHRFWIASLTQEHANLRAALANSVKDDPSNALRIASALRRFWHFRGNLREGFSWFSQALDRHAELDLGEDMILARALSEAGNLAWFLGLEESHELQRRSVDLWQELGDRKGRAYALWQLGKATWTVKSDLALARKLVRESIDILRDIGDIRGLANALLWAGFLALAKGDVLQAQVDLGESSKLAAETNFTNVLAAAISGLGRIDFWQGNYISAQKRLEQSMSMFQDLGDLIGVQIVAAVFGELRHMTGDYAGAESCYVVCMNVDRIVNGKESDQVVCMLSMNLCRQGRFSEARQLLRRVQAVQRNDDSPQLLRYAVALAALGSTTGKLHVAAQLLGYFDMGIELDGETVETVFKFERDRITDDLRSQIGEESFSVYWNRGRELSGKLHTVVL